ncbi:MAG: FxLYD domain-containing protein [Actinomycetota bacterium]|jgi:hypothetical protein
MSETPTWPAPGTPTDPTVPPPAPAKKSHKKRNIIFAVVGGLFIIGLASGGGSSGSGNSDNDPPSTGAKTGSGAGGVESNQAPRSSPAAADFELTKCSSSEAFGTVLPDVEVTITNHSSKRSNYSASVNLLDSSGNKVGEGFLASNNVEPGQSATESVAATASRDFSTCRIVSVNRYAS